jgi:hypothetical protein
MEDVEVNNNCFNFGSAPSFVSPAHHVEARDMSKTWNIQNK